MTQPTHASEEHQKLSQLTNLVDELSAALEGHIFEENYEIASALEPFVTRFRAVLPATDDRYRNLNKTRS